MDWLVEGGVFELAVPIREQSDDSIKLSFATSTRTAKSHRPAAHFLARLRVVAGSDRPRAADLAHSRLTDVPTAASKVNVEIADSTYRPADVVLQNLEEARDNLIIIAAEHPRRGVPAEF